MLQIQSAQASGFATLRLSPSPAAPGGTAGTAISLGGNNIIILAGVAPGALHASTFVFT